MISILEYWTTRHTHRHQLWVWSPKKALPSYWQTKKNGGSNSQRVGVIAWGGIQLTQLEYVWKLKLAIHKSSKQQIKEKSRGHWHPFWIPFVDEDRHLTL